MIVFDVESFQSLLKSEYVGKTLIYTELTGSTMDDARRLAGQVTENPHGTVIISERQTKARGARDHKWDASNTGNIYASFILHLPPVFKTFEGRFDLEVASCLAVTQVAQSLGVSQALPKWPNDVWVRGHKLAGFLAEDGKWNIPGSPNVLVVLGMGINVNADVRRNSELNLIATSIKCELNGQQINREQFFADVCLAFEHYLHQTREMNLNLFREKNLFQSSQSILINCPSEGKIFDGKFLNIRENWDIQFSVSDTKGDKILRGRSDHFTIRPKIVREIIVVFSTNKPQTAPEQDRESHQLHSDGLKCSISPEQQSTSPASHVCSMLESLVDVSKCRVHLEPDTFIVESEEWMKSCSLLVLPENISKTQLVTPRISTFLASGGNILSTGYASLHLAQVIDIPVKEVTHSYLASIKSPVVIQTELLNSSESVAHNSTRSKLDSRLNLFSAGSGIIYTFQSEQEGKKSLDTANIDSQISSTCQDTSLQRSMLYSYQFITEEFKILSNLTDFKTKVASTAAHSEQVKSSTRHGTDMCLVNTSKTQIGVAARYIFSSLVGEDSMSEIAACVIKLSSGSFVGLVGFDLGMNYLSVSGDLLFSKEDTDMMDNERFKRDIFVQEMVNHLLW